MAECPNCGAAVSDDVRYCPNCGARVEGHYELDEDEVDVDVKGWNRSNPTRESMFYVGAVLGVIAVVFLPFFFFLVALPEAIINMYSGGSIVDSLGKDGRDNPAVRGTFLIFRWFGNFLLLVFVLAFFAGVILVLA
jgi:hypothetical protein